MRIRSFLRSFAFAACATISGFSHSQTFPAAQPIRMIVPFAPGGTVDILARLIADNIAKPLGQNIIVENKPGAGSAIGTEYVARSEPNGYTLLMASTSSMAINPNLQKLNYRLEDFAPISLVASVPHVLVVNPNVPAKNLKEFLAYAKGSGAVVSYATAGPGTPHHLAGALLNQLAGLNMVDVPYKGTGPALTDVAGGQLQVMSVDLPPALPFISSGKVRPLGVAAKARSPFAPDIPTVAEAGLSGFEVMGWYGIVAPANVPKDVVERLSGAISKALASPDVQAKLAQLGATAEDRSGAAFGAFMHAESAKWSEVIKTANIKVSGS
jgi:tripartite-type tricarboxylate transporter receptor subunit TctC